MLRKGYGGLYKAPKVKARESKRLRGEDKIIFIDLRIERGQIVGLGKRRRRQDAWGWTPP